MKKEYTRSDLACESSASGAVGMAGTDYRAERVGGFCVERMRITDEATARKLGKPCGTYVTFLGERIDRLSDGDSMLLSRLVAGELRGLAAKLTGKRVGAELGVLVMGLGNAELTADAIGPQVVSSVTATRHLQTHERRLFDGVGCASLSTLAPGVLGQTGIEAMELLRSAVSCVQPDLVIVIDALAARRCERLATTVQISDTGIEPGSGVGNHRAAISRASVGVPVIALGVPTVVDSSSLVYDVLEQAGIEDIDDALRDVLENGKSFFVSPKECDVICARVAEVLGRAIDFAFAGELVE